MKAISLQNALYINAASSGATGLLMISFPGMIQEIFGAKASWPFVEVGTFLIVFALVTGFVGRSNPVRHKAVRAIIALDSLWVVCSVLMIILQPFTVNVIGNMMIAGVALWVAAMIYLQATRVREYAAAK